MSTPLAAAQARVETFPQNAEAHNDLGMLLGDEGRFLEAAACFRQALMIARQYPQALHNLGMALMELGQADEAERSFRELLALAPQVGVFHVDHGAALLALGRYAEAEESYRCAVRLEPGSAAGHFGLANALRRLGRLAESEPAYRAALGLEPRLADAQSALAVTLFNLGRSEEAEQAFGQALTIDARSPVAHADFAHMLSASSRLAEAEQSYRRALALKPTLAVAHSSLALLLNHIPGRSAAEIYAEHQAFNQRFRASEAVQPHDNRPDPERALRIGYVSADLRQHSVAFFIAPLLSRHDAGAYQAICYYTHPGTDTTTARLKSYAAQWRDVAGLRAEALADLIRRDEVDILVDLGGHTGNNRLLAFARKPAPVQATWLGYLNTTGLETMDWRITDARATPEGPLDALHSERLLRLPDSQWCYEPPEPCPAVVPPPSLRSGSCTFAAFSTAAKMNDEVIELWSRLLHAVNGSRLLVVANGLGSIPAAYRERFTKHGIGEDRLQLLPARSFEDYLALHGSADVVLDTFPYTGGTTTCHALWMGVPVVSLMGDTATSRGGASVLHALGLSDLIAATRDQYLEIAARLAADRDRLSSLRLELRDRMRSSPLTDAVRFTRNFEQAYRTMWRRWCADHSNRNPA